MEMFLKGEERENVGNLETHLGEGSNATYIVPGIDMNSLSLSRKKKAPRFLALKMRELSLTMASFSVFIGSATYIDPGIDINSLTTVNSVA